jgi:tripartite-type tricarboxylate transporter receptor subunit TctC
MSNRWLHGIAVSIGLAVSQFPSPSVAADFYAGKTITILNSSDTGGGFDTYTRILAQYLPKYIPGNPTVIVQGVVGAGGLRAAELLYGGAPKDGTTIGNLRSSNLVDSILGIRGTQIKPEKFEWLGSMGSDTDLCSFWYTSGVKTFDDLRNKEVIVGASGKGAQNFSFPNAINKLLGTKMKIVLGYKGMEDRMLALQSGELQGNCGMYSSSVASVHMGLIKDDKLIPVMQSGLTPSPAFPDVPLTQSFAKNDADRQLLTALFGQMEIARLFAAPPGIPKDRAAILQKAFAEALVDPGLLAETDKLGGGRPTLVDSNRVQGIIKQMEDLPADRKAALRGLIDG